MKTVAELKKQRAAAVDALKALAAKDILTAEEQSQWESHERAISEADTEIPRIEAIRLAAASGAQAVLTPSGSPQERTVSIQPVADAYTDDSFAKKRGFGTSAGLTVGGMVRLCALAGGNIYQARQIAGETLGESHPVTRALITSVGASGGFIIPPDYMNEIIELLRPAAVVRASGPRVIPMPRGTMTLPAQTSPATATYGTETSAITSSQPGVGQIVATFKKLTALVPVSNDMMRYADPAADAFVRDDLVKIMALRQDLAFLLGDGTQATPMGFTGFANRYAVNSGGTAGSWSTTSASTAAVGGQFLTSNENYSLATAAQELGGLANQLDIANVPETKRVWFGNPRTFNYLYNVQNSLGVYVYREEMQGGKLLGYPFKKSTQIPINLWDATGTNKDCSFLLLAEMDAAMIFDSMTMELAVSREGTYINSSGNTVSAFTQDQTLVRAIAEHDFQIRHDQAVAVLQFVRWAPAIT
ncbi:MAG: phage major capsid protein [Steroidobacteraceae bacterium]